MRILWLAHEGNISGANICLLEFLDILNESNAVHYVMVPWEGAMADKARVKAKQVDAIKFYSWIWPLHTKHPSISVRARRWIRNRKAVKDIEKLIYQYNPDFVVTNTVTTPVAALAAKKAGKKHIWFIHEFGEEDHGYTISTNFSHAATTINALSYKVAFNSNAVSKKYERFITPGKSCIVHNALLVNPSLSKFSSNGSSIKLVMLGQISASKNQLEALKAVKLCADNGLNVDLKIIGKAEGDSYMNTLMSFIEENRLASYIHFPGATDKPEEALEHAELLLMCSRMEAFGRVTVEALKHGIPVIAANTGGSIEIIKDGKNGYLYESGSCRDLADKILQYAANRQQFDRSSIALDASNTYNFQNTKKQLLEVFS